MRGGREGEVFLPGIPALERGDTNFPLIELSVRVLERGEPVRDSRLIVPPPPKKTPVANFKIK